MKMTIPDRTSTIKLSVVIVVRNAERTIGQAIRSAGFADECLVVDTGSTDQTLEIIKESGVRLLLHSWEGYAKTKQWAVEQAANDWVFLLDADEMITEGLSKEVGETLVTKPDSIDGFSCPRKNYFLGKWMRWGGWYPDRVVRLFRKSQVQFTQVQVHETVQVNGDLGTLQSPLEHFTDDTLKDYLYKLNIYTTLSAKDLTEKGKHCHWWDLWFRPIWMLLRMAIFKLGILDGWRGILLAALSGIHVLVKYAKLRNWESESKQ
jgi:glycosyltransferase involved in cell wall biosynthesis